MNPLRAWLPPMRRELIDTLRAETRPADVPPPGSRWQFPSGARRIHGGRVGCCWASLKDARSYMGEDQSAYWE